MLGLICDFVSVQMITSLGGDIKPLDLYPSSYLINNLEGDVKKVKMPLAHLPEQPSHLPPKILHNLCFFNSPG